MRVVRDDIRAPAAAQGDVMHTPRHVLGAVLLLLALAVPGEARAKEPAAPTPEAELLQSEQRRYRAMVDADAPALEALLGEEVRFTHSNGRVQSRADLLGSLASGALDYLSIRTRDEAVRLYGDAGVVSGAAEIEVRAAGGPKQALRLLFTAVYAKQGGGWRLVAYQSTRAPEADAR
jgi:ketosteroid isomerase-like protein